jgi:UDPglucose 6-dehydrogenase
MKIAMIGSGYVGLVSGVCFSDFGFEVTCVDKDAELVKSLQDGKPHIFEAGLEEMMEKNLYYKRLRFTDDLEQAVRDSDLIFIAVCTPEGEDGSADLTCVYEVAREIGRAINGYKVVVNKSTVPVGTGQRVKAIIREEIQRRGEDIDFDMVSNPEFLRQGSAVYDFTHMDRVVIGSESERAVDMMREAYRVLYLNETPFMLVNIETAELVKYASNAFLATKISFVNELSELCEKVGANIQQVSKGMGMDGRIGPKFLHAGPGYGGSCFPKDTRALSHTAGLYGVDLGIVNATIQANERQKTRMGERIMEKMGGVENKKIAVLGLAFKNNTDDDRGSPALHIIGDLYRAGALVKAYDPQAIPKAQKTLQADGVEIEYANDEYEAAQGADALVIATEWNQFRSLDLGRIQEAMAGNYFFDLRNIYPAEAMRDRGFDYHSVGRP